MTEHISNEETITLLDWKKDIDGLHPMNSGMLHLKGFEPLFTSATSAACLKILQHWLQSGELGKVDWLRGKNCVVIGRSNAVGSPI